MEFVKRAPAPDAVADRSIRETVESMLANIEQGREASALDYAKKLDDWVGDVVLCDEKRAALIEQVPKQVREDIQFAYKQVKRFAEAQRDSLQ